MKVQYTKPHTAVRATAGSSTVKTHGVLKLGQNLPLERCPYCNIAKPLLINRQTIATTTLSTQTKYHWGMYECTTCAGIVMARADQTGLVSDIWPEQSVTSDALPPKAREYLKQAKESPPAGALMLAASSVDAMLKDKGYKTGSLNTRIDQASKDHLITAEMAAWAHDIRLDANDQRHADEEARLPEASDAAKVIKFAQALGEFLYVLPALVERGRKQK